MEFDGLITVSGFNKLNLIYYLLGGLEHDFYPFSWEFHPN
jgi:hypothetical protein